MTQLAMDPSPHACSDTLACSEVIGTVRDVGAAGITVDLGSSRCRAKRAVGCLVEPAVDDVVLVALVGDGRAYVLSVLEREAAEVTLSVAGDLTVKAHSGAVRIAADDGVTVATSAKVSIVASALEVSALDGKIMLERAAFFGDKILTEVNRVRTVAGAVDRTFGRLIERIQRAYRTVEETDHLRAESIDHRAQKTIKMHAENTLMTSEQLVKIDGSQVHIG